MDNNKKLIARASDYRRVFGTTYGKKVLNDLIKNNHVMDACVGKDDKETYIMLGQRNAVLRVLAFMNLDVQQVLERIKQGDKYE